jgi:large subunit ribosomal protein L5
MGIREQIIFQEINQDKVTRITGLNIVLCTSANSDEKALALLEDMGMPFRKTVGEEK